MIVSRYFANGMENHYVDKLKFLFDNNEVLAKKRVQKNPNYFKDLARGQEPKYLWIGCSDSRVPPGAIVGLEPGEMFVHRNIANLVIHTDFNCLSVIEFAVNSLNIEHILVCGHYGCGGIQSAMEPHPAGFADNWLHHIKDIYAKHVDKLDEITDLNTRLDALVEISVEEQVKNVCHTSIVQNAWSNGKNLFVHGLVYDLHTGLIKDLNCHISKTEQLKDIYVKA